MWKQGNIILLAEAYSNSRILSEIKLCDEKARSLLGHETGIIRIFMTSENQQVRPNAHICPSPLSPAHPFGKQHIKAGFPEWLNSVPDLFFPPLFSPSILYEKDCSGFATCPKQKHGLSFSFLKSNCVAKPEVL